MIKRQIALFFLRWLVSTTAMWVCIQWFATVQPDHNTIWLYLLAGLIFSFANAVIKPILTILSLPFIVLTMGIFVLVLNTAMVGLTVWLLPEIEMTFGQAFLSSIVISIINLLVNLLVPAYNKK